ncbi:MAG: conjugative transposon protein TraM, partial [Rikenellaceae bacterium]
MKIKDIKLPFGLKPKDVGIKALALVVGIAIICFIYRDKDEKPKVEIVSGLNAVVPDPATPKINDGKLQQTPRERAEQTIDIRLVTNGEEVEQVEETTEVAQVNTAYKSANMTVANFYNRPKVDNEKIRMQAEIAELKAEMKRQNKLAELPPPDNTIEDQLTIIERSYELAAKYSAKAEPQPEPYKNGKAQINPMSQVSSSVVSSLTPTSDATFSTAVGAAVVNDRNTISACIHSDQTITNSGAVKIRLLEPMMIGKYELPKGAIFTGQSRVNGERLTISIKQIEHLGRIIPVELLIIDTDGEEGIFIPNSMEVSALKTIVAGMGKDAGSSVSITSQSAGAEL